MIEINLLPEELLKEKTKKSEGPPQYILPVLFLVAAGLITVNLLLAVAIVIRSYQLVGLNNQWEKLKPQQKLVGDFKQTYAGLSQENQLIQKLLKKRMNWAEKLNHLSLALPSGIWFREVSFKADGSLILAGSVISLSNTSEMGLLNKFIANLRNNQSFFKDFSKLELGTVQKRTVPGYEVSDFVFTGNLKLK